MNAGVNSFTGKSSILFLVKHFHHIEMGLGCVHVWIWEIRSFVKHLKENLMSIQFSFIPLMLVNLIYDFLKLIDYIVG